MYSPRVNVVTQRPVVGQTSFTTISQSSPSGYWDYDTSVHPSATGPVRHYGNATVHPGMLDGFNVQMHPEIKAALAAEAQRELYYQAHADEMYGFGTNHTTAGLYDTPVVVPGNPPGYSPYSYTTYQQPYPAQQTAVQTTTTTTTVAPSYSPYTPAYPQQALYPQQQQQYPLATSPINTPRRLANTTQPMNPYLQRY